MKVGSRYRGIPKSVEKAESRAAIPYHRYSIKDAAILS